MMQLALDIRQERARLSGQCAKILGRLQRGIVTNRELAEKYSLKYTSRISDLRKRDHDIRVVARDYETGLVWYALFIGGHELL